MLPPEMIVTIEKVGSHPDGGDQYLAVTTRSDGTEICRNDFRFQPDLLIDFEPQWMLEKAVPRYNGETIKRGPVNAIRLDEEEEKLAIYGQRLYGFLFGNGEKLRSFLKFNDSYRRQARLTLAMHGNAAALWRLPWEYLHDSDDFLALHGRFLLSRVPHGLGQMEPPPAPLPLRILVIIAAPDDQKPLDTEEEIGVVQAALDEAVRAGRVRVEYLDDATLPAIGDTLRSFRPHVLHYTGHGSYDPQKEQSYLALEDDSGKTRPASIAELRPHLKDARDLRLVVLSGCQTARTSDVDAFRGVATGLLQESIPAVLAMQFSILDQSGIKLAEVFYAALAQGDTPTEAAQRVRLALWQSDEGPGYDWGIPALYLRAQGMRLIDPTQAAEVSEDVRSLIDMGGLPLPPYFVGRKSQLRTLRRALRERTVNAVFVRGIGGMGKSSLAAKLLQRPGTELDGALVVRCHEVAPLDIPAKLARFLEAQGKAGHAEAAALLLDSRLPPADRARQALSRIADRRYVFVFDNFESVMDISPLSLEGGGAGGGGEAAFGVADPDLAGLLAGLLQAHWRGLCLFTGRFRWRGLDEHLGRGTADEIHLPALTARQTIMLMDNLPRLRLQPLQTKIELYKKVGGHPKSIELLEGWLASGRVTDLLADPNLDGLLAQEWEDYFLRALLAQLRPAVREALTRLSIFRTRLGDAEFEYAGVEAATVRRWLDLSLLQRERLEMPDLPKELEALLHLLPEAERSKLMRAESYSVHSVVGEYLLGQVPSGELRELHTWAAAYHGQPFVEMARRAATQSGESWTEEQIEALARDRDGVVGQMVHRTDNLAQARAGMTRALEWQHHLFAAGAYEEAWEIVTAVFSVLARWGERDRAKALLRGSVETQEGFNKAVARMNLATLLIEEGKLDEALATYQEVYRTFEALEAKQQMGAALNQQSILYHMMGRYDDAVITGEKGLELKRERRDEEGQAISLHQLSIFYMSKGDYTTALARSEEAEKLNRSGGREHLLAGNLHEQGLILNRLTRAAQTDEERATHRRAAAERFQESLVMTRRVGDEAGAADTLTELGGLLMNAGQYREAIAAITEGLEIRQRLGLVAKVGISLEFLGVVHERQGQYVAALEKYQQALELARQYSSPQYAAIVENHIARVRAKLGGG
jgi:tetratricopeptide (TPR) repeat protein